jgi:hypothetical protein
MLWLSQKTEGIMAQTFREHWLDWLVVAVLLSLFGLAVGGSRAAYTGSTFPLDWQPWWDGFLQNSGTEMLGAFLTFVLLELIRGRRERRYQEEAEERRTKQTQELVRGLMQAQEIARLRAAKTIEERQPILDSMEATGLLRGANLSEASLEGAKLDWADLQGVDLFRANLQGAFLWGANLQGAAYLTVEQLRQAKDLEGATLPDGTKLPGRTLKTILNGVPKPHWREAFEAWCEMVETVSDWRGGPFIKPADLPPADE